MKHILAYPLFILFLAQSGNSQSLAPLRVGWTGPLTGSCAVVGVDSVPAIELAFAEANQEGGVYGRPLELVVENDEYQVTKAVSAYQKLVSSDGVKIVIASTYGGIFATATKALQDDVLVIDPLDCNDEIAKLPQNTLCLATRTESIAQGFVDDITAQGIRKVLLLVEESDGWMQLIAARVRADLEVKGIEVLEELTPSSATDYKPNLLRAKQRSLEAGILLGNDQMGTALKQARDLQLSLQWYGVGSVLSPGFQKLAGNEIESIKVSSWTAPRDSAFNDFLVRYRARTGRAPALELASVPAYDLGKILITCLRTSMKESRELSTSKMRECLLKTKNYPGLSGNITFDPDGAVRSINEKLFIVKNGNLTDYPTPAQP